MTDVLTISAKLRDTSKKSIGKSLKKDGNVLSVLYGRGKEYSLYMNRREFQIVFTKAGKHSIIALDIEGEGKKEVLVKNYTIDGIKRYVDHVDFYEIDRNQKIKTTVPIHIVGVPDGVRLGLGTMEQIEHDLTIRAFPSSIPHEIAVDVAALQVGDSIHLSDVEFTDGVEPIGDKSRPIVTVVANEEDSSSTDAKV